ncbi:MAG: hypothetical protein HY329_23665, partial [Chloroflexi bacterium]|nr:hypothetical protein [Chloroflexota bacterium]
MTLSVSAPGAGAPTEVAVKIVDTDVHPSPRSASEALDFIPEPWRSRNLPNEVYTLPGAPL